MWVQVMLLVKNNGLFLVGEAEGKQLKGFSIDVKPFINMKYVGSSFSA